MNGDHDRLARWYENGVANQTALTSLEISSDLMFYAVKSYISTIFYGFSCILFVCCGSEKKPPPPIHKYHWLIASLGMLDNHDVWNLSAC